MHTSVYSLYSSHFSCFSPWRMSSTDSGWMPKICKRTKQRKILCNTLSLFLFWFSSYPGQLLHDFQVVPKHVQPKHWVRHTFQHRGIFQLWQWANRQCRQPLWVEHQQRGGDGRLLEGRRRRQRRRKNSEKMIINEMKEKIKPQFPDPFPDLWSAPWECSGAFLGPLHSLSCEAAPDSPLQTSADEASGPPPQRQLKTAAAVVAVIDVAVSLHSNSKLLLLLEWLGWGHLTRLMWLAAGWTLLHLCWNGQNGQNG